MALAGAADLAGMSSVCSLPASGGLGSRTAHRPFTSDPSSRTQSKRRQIALQAAKQNPKAGSHLRDPEARFRR